MGNSGSSPKQVEQPIEQPSNMTFRELKEKIEHLDRLSMKLRFNDVVQEKQPRPGDTVSRESRLAIMGGEEL